MEIIKATYGNKDVTEIVKSNVKNGTLVIQASNSIFGDPQIGMIKSLNVKTDSGDYSVNENLFLHLPKNKNTRLGIFYSNNNDNKIIPCIKKSLSCIKVAAKNDVDIITNFWNSLGSDNPFIETIAWTNTSSHLNQVLQILQCLYMAQTIGSYSYVSFLEHDVLYPEGYFDYDNFENDCICNTNYIGMNKNGFQNNNTNHQPLSQLTMRMKYAIEHFESILPNAILYNNGLVEPKTKILNWQCKNPSVHVNHGKHFTSHYSIYESNTTTANEYWGLHDNFKNLFF